MDNSTDTIPNLTSSWDKIIHVATRYSIKPTKTLGRDGLIIFFFLRAALFSILYSHNALI
ncbi:MAG: hypothetical protein QW716_03945 [Desulfurococcaceae archaeon]